MKASAKRLKESRYKRWHLSMMKTEKLIKAATEKELIEVSLSIHGFLYNLDDLLSSGMKMVFFISVEVNFKNHLWFWCCLAC